MTKPRPQAAVLHVQAQRMALITFTGAAVFAVILVAAFVGEVQQALQDLLMQGMRGPIDGARP